MSVEFFESLPQDSRLWIFGAQDEFTEEQKSLLRKHLDVFVGAWNSHKKDVSGGWIVRFDRFVIVSVDESATRVSGCSIDSLVRCLKGFEHASGVNILGTSGRVFFRDGKNIRCVTREGFSQLVSEGVVSEDTIVFDNTIHVVGDLVSGKWEVPMKVSWHGKAFGSMIEA